MDDVDMGVRDGRSVETGKDDDDDGEDASDGNMVRLPSFI